MADGNILITMVMGADTSYPTVDAMIEIMKRKNPVPDVFVVEMTVEGGIDKFSFLRNGPSSYLYNLRRANGRMSIENRNTSVKELIRWATSFKNQYGKLLEYRKPPFGGGAGAGAGGPVDPFAFGGYRRRRMTRRRRR